MGHRWPPEAAVPNDVLLALLALGTLASRVYASASCFTLRTELIHFMRKSVLTNTPVASFRGQVKSFESVQDNDGVLTSREAHTQNVNLICVLFFGCFGFLPPDKSNEYHSSQ